jgi:hypothetical protein
MGGWGVLSRWWLSDRPISKFPPRASNYADGHRPGRPHDHATRLWRGASAVAGQARAEGRARRDLLRAVWTLDRSTGSAVLAVR